MTTSTRRTGPDRDTVMKVLDRDGYRCVRCSAPIVAEPGGTWRPHHRRPRAMGGTARADANGPANLISLCVGCHGWVESQEFSGYTHGWLVHMHHMPADVPVMVGGRSTVDGGRWVLLDDQGGSSPFLREVGDG